MISSRELLEWAKTLDPFGCVAIDDGGLSLVELDQEGDVSDAYIEVGGIPEEEGDEKG